MPALLALLFALGATKAHAQPRDALALRWSAPPECPDGDAVRARVRALSGSRVSAGSPLRVQGVIRRQRDASYQLQLSVQVEDLVGERQIAGKSCDDLSGAAAVALALLLRSAEPLTQEDLAGAASEGGRTLASAARDGDASTPAGQVQSVSSVSAVSATGSPSTDVSLSQKRSARRGYGLLQVPLVTLGYGPLRHASFALMLAAGLSLGRWSILAEGGAWLPQRVEVGQGTDRYGARVRRFAAGVRACHAFLDGRLQLAPCLSLSAQHLAARGTGSHVVAREAKATWIAVAVGAQANFSLTRWLQLVAGVDAQFQTATPKIFVEDSGRVERLLPIAATLRLGAEWIL